MNAIYPDLKNKIVLITGGGSGIGSSIVEMIADESKTKEFGRIGEYLREMKTAIS